jgi:hypothetical protein
MRAARANHMSGIVLRRPSFPNSRRRFEIIWADRIAIYVAIGWAVFLLLAWLMAIVACGFAGGWLLVKDTAMLALEAGLALVVPIWFALTGLDLLFKGPARRRAKTK